MSKKLLIFTGVGDNEDHFLSWANTPSDIFDRALNYYGNDQNRVAEIKKVNPEYFFEGSGMIWENFYKNFHNFKNYSYYLIVDSDLFLDMKSIENHLEYVVKNNVHGSTWSRTLDSYGYFTPLFLSRTNDQEAYYSNWIEMCFMMLSSELTRKTVEIWSSLGLYWSTGIDFVVANVALNNNMLPFHISNNCKFRNVPPSEKKNGREIDIITNSNTDERLRDIFLLMDHNNFFKIKPMDILTWES